MLGRLGGHVTTIIEHLEVASAAPDLAPDVADLAAARESSKMVAGELVELPVRPSADDVEAVARAANEIAKAGALGVRMIEDAATAVTATAAAARRPPLKRRPRLRLLRLPLAQPQSA